jgi:hypothetical protein
MQPFCSANYIDVNPRLPYQTCPLDLDNPNSAVGIRAALTCSDAKKGNESRHFPHGYLNS